MYQSKVGPFLMHIISLRELKRARHIGSFESEEDAARAYDREAIKMLGPDAGLNFRESECPMLLPQQLSNSPP